MRRALERVKVISCADGTFHITPKWRKQYQKPGLFTRMYLAERFQAALNGALRVKKK